MMYSTSLELILSSITETLYHLTITASFVLPSCPWQSLLYSQILRLIVLDSTYNVITKCLSFYARLISLCIMSSRSIHVVANGRISFLSNTGQYSIVWIDYIPLSIYSSIEGTLGYFYTLVVVNNSTMKMRVQISH